MAVAGVPLVQVVGPYTTATRDNGLANRVPADALTS